MTAERPTGIIGLLLNYLITFKKFKLMSSFKFWSNNGGGGRLHILKAQDKL